MGAGGFRYAVDIGVRLRVGVRAGGSEEVGLGERGGKGGGWRDVEICEVCRNPSPKHGSRIVAT